MSTSQVIDFTVTPGEATITITRYTAAFPKVQASDLPEDVRRALRDWLDSE